MKSYNYFKKNWDALFQQSQPNHGADSQKLKVLWGGDAAYPVWHGWLNNVLESAKRDWLL